MNNERQYCNNCEQLVTPVSDVNWWWVIALCLLFWPAAIIYYLWKDKKANTCPICNSDNWRVESAEPTAEV